MDENSSLSLKRVTVATLFFHHGDKFGGKSTVSVASERHGTVHTHNPSLPLVENKIAGDRNLLFKSYDIGTLHLPAFFHSHTFHS